MKRYYHRASDDPEGLTFKRWEAQPGEVLIINSSKFRAVQGTAMEFILRLLIPQVQPLRRSSSAQVRGGLRCALRWTTRLSNPLLRSGCWRRPLMLQSGGHACEP